MEQIRMWWILLCHLLLVQTFKVQSFTPSKPGPLTPKEAKNVSEITSGKAVQRTRRFVRPVIILTRAIHITIKALGIAEKLKDPCMAYPRICKNKEILQKLMVEESVQKNKLQSAYDHFFEEANNLQIIFFNLESIFIALKENIDTSFKIFDSAFLWMDIHPLYLQEKVNLTSEQLDEITSVLPSHAENMFNQDRQRVFDFLGIDFIAKVFFCVPFQKMMHSLKLSDLTEYSKAGGAVSIDNVTGNLIKLNLTSFAAGSVRFVSAKFSDLYHLYQLALNNSMNTGGNIRSILPVSYSEIKEQREALQNKIKSSLEAIKNEWQMSFNTFNRSGMVWGASDIAGLQNKVIDKELEDLKDRYSIYLSDMKLALSNVTYIIKVLKEELQTAINRFQELVGFVEEMKDTSEDISKWAGGIHVDTEQREIDSLHFKNTSGANIIKKQAELLAFLRQQSSILQRSLAKNTRRIVIWNEVKDALKKHREVDIIADLVNNKLQDRVRENNKVEKERILCEIALQFPGDFYDYYNLNIFRPDCSQSVSFAEEERKRNDRKSKYSNIEIALKNCELFDFCPPIKTIASLTGMTETEVKSGMKMLRPDKAEYLGEPL